MSPKLTATIERREQLTELADDLLSHLSLKPGFEASDDEIKLALANACLLRGLALLEEVNQVSRDVVLRGLVYRTLKSNPSVRDTAYVKEALWEKDQTLSETPETSTSPL